MNKSISKKTEIQTVYAMMLITVSFFLTQVYPRLFLETEGNLIIALVILGTFLCNVRYGATTGIILAIFVLVTRFIHIVSGFDNWFNLSSAKGGRKHSKIFQLERYMTSGRKRETQAAQNYQMQADKWASTKEVEQKDGTKKEEPIWTVKEAQGYAEDLLDELLGRAGRGGIPVTFRQIKYFDGKLNKYNKGKKFNRDFMFKNRDDKINKSRNYSKLVEQRNAMARLYGNSTSKARESTEDKDGDGVEDGKKFKEIEVDIETAYSQLSPESDRARALLKKRGGFTEQLLRYERPSGYMNQATIDAVIESDSGSAQDLGKLFANFMNADQKIFLIKTLRYLKDGPNILGKDGGVLIKDLPGSPKYTLASAMKKAAEMSKQNASDYEKIQKSLLNTEKKVWNKDEAEKLGRPFIGDDEYKILDLARKARDLPLVGGAYRGRDFELDGKTLKLSDPKHRPYPIGPAGQQTDGWLTQRFHEVLGAPSLGEAQDIYNKFFRRYLTEVAGITLDKLVYGLNARDLKFPIRNAKSSRDFRKKTVMDQRDGQRANWKLNRDWVPRMVKEIEEQNVIKEYKKQKGVDMKKFEAAIKKDEEEAKKLRETAAQELKDAELKKAEIIAAANLKLAQAQAAAGQRKKLTLKEVEDMKKEGQRLADEIVEEAKLAKKAEEEARAEREKLYKEQKKKQDQIAEDARKRIISEAEAKKIVAEELEKEAKREREAAAALRRKAEADAKIKGAQTQAALEAGLRSRAQAEAALARAQREAADAKAAREKAEQELEESRKAAAKQMADLREFERQLMEAKARATEAERVAAAQRIRLEALLREARKAKSQTIQASINIREELARERERRAAAEQAVIAERKRADTIKAIEEAKCAKEKAEERRIRLRREQIREARLAAEERARQEKADAERREIERIAALRRTQAKELALARDAELRKMKIQVVNQQQREKEDEQMKQVLRSQSMRAANPASDVATYAPSSASQLGKDGLPVQFTLDELYRGQQVNSYLNLRKPPSSTVYVDKNTLGGYVGPITSQLFDNAKPKK